MLRYSKNSKEINIFDTFNNGFKLTPSNNRTFEEINNGFPLKDIVDNYLNGFEIGSINYVKSSTKRFIKTNNITPNCLLDFSSVEYMKVNNKIINNIVILEDNDIIIAKDGGGNGLGECSLYIKNSNFDDYMCGAGLILRISGKMKRSYILGMLKSKHFKEFIDNQTPIASTLRHSNTISLNYKLNDFDVNNEKHLLLSYITQNLIDKELQIKEKNILIDTLIDDELGVKNHNSNQVFADKDMFIKNGFRFSAGLYNKDYLNIFNSIKNYKNGSFNISEKYNYKRGQNLQESNIGKSFYSDKKINGFYTLITAQDFSENRTINNIRYLGNKNKNLLKLQKSCIIVNATGFNTGRTIYFNNINNENIITNINQWVFSNKGENIILDVFVSSILSYLKRNMFFDNIKDPSNGGFIVKPHIENFLNIPNFDEEKQKEISKEYFNNVSKKENTLDSYLDNEKLRNKELGIWQLNQEIFLLKEQLETIVESIVFNKNIEITDFI